ncbi:MAG: hypothetical protein SynsKO_23650 [Synoicihabitans sp.]
MNAQKPIKAFKHKHAERAAIPSHEEAGAEAASKKVSDGATARAYPRNPVVHRGQDPELFWLNKYGETDTEDKTPVDIRSLYRHEHIQPEMLLPSLIRVVETDEDQADLFGTGDFFTQAFGEADELTKPGEYYYKHKEWTNRLIQGDSLLVMNSLLEREGMAGQVQCIYIDPPYGIKYGSNWQIKLNDRSITDGKDDHLSGEPEQVKAFRDTWELGIHSYLSYLRDRLVVAKDLLHESGSCFVQISDENIHLVRCLMDEVFGSDNFCSQITVRKTTSEGGSLLGTTCDFLLWYGKDKGQTKCRSLYTSRSDEADSRYTQLLLPDGSIRTATMEERTGMSPLPDNSKLFRLDNITSSRPAGDGDVKIFSWKGMNFKPGKGTFKTTQAGLENLANSNRLQVSGAGKLNYRRFKDDFGYAPINSLWADISGAVQSRSDPKVYVVQTSTAMVQRCILMTTDPGDLVVDPTCGSGTTAFVAEQWGRRWITTDTSRIAINLAKQRIMTARFPYYSLHDQDSCDLRQGFRYKTVPHLTLGSIANNEPPTEETLYDQPEEDKKRLRIAGPFTVETLQNFDPVSPNAVSAIRKSDAELGKFEDVVFEHLKSAGVKTGDKQQNAIFHRVDRLADVDLHAEGFYDTADGEAKAYLHIGPKFGTISKQAVNKAVKTCRRRGDADWLIILGFSFESDIVSQSVTSSQGQFQVSKVRMHDDLLQEGLLKRDKKAASFVTIGEPDIGLEVESGEAIVEIRGLDIYDPIKDQVKSRDIHDIAYWMLDTDYDGANFIVRQAFFCGGTKKEFAQWRKGLDNLAKLKAKKKAEKTLKIEIDEDAFDRLYGHRGHPFKVAIGQEVAIRVISQFGEETTKVLQV